MEYIKSALANIKLNKGRTFLTMLGIIIGISSVITIMSVGNGMKASVNSSLDNMTNGAVTIKIDAKKTDKYLTPEQLKTIREAVPEIRGVTPSVTAYGTSDIRRSETVDVRVFGGNEDYICEFDDGIAAGRFYTEDEVDSAAEVVVLTEVSALYFFGTTDVLGLTLPLDIAPASRDVTIIGIMRSTPEDIEYAQKILAAGELRYVWADIYMPYSTLTDRFGLLGDNITSFSVYPVFGMADEAALKAKTVAEGLLGLRGEGAVQIQSYASMMEMYSSILDAVTVVIALVAAISLIVGGIGVMNIMTVTVTERTREIGIRKSLGARTSYIMLQFLTESATITCIGGIIGLGLGYLFGLLIEKVGGVDVLFIPRDILLAIFVSTAIGIFFGIYPARKAARLNPIDALRTE